MDGIIYFRLGETDQITFGQLVATMIDVKGLLLDFDAALSRDPRGTLRWNVEVIEKRSPVVIGVSPVQSRQTVDPAIFGVNFGSQVETAVIKDTARLTFEADRGDLVSDSAIGRYTRLAKRSRRIGDIAVYTDSRSVPINESTLTNIHRLVGTKSKSTGSVLGRLDTISVHRHNEIRIWDDNHQRPITCRYPAALEETVKASLRQRVLVSGVVSYNEIGRATAVDVSLIAPYPDDAELPSVERMQGSVSNMTGGESLADYLEHLRDG